MWIKTKDRLPDHMGTVLVKYHGRLMLCMFINKYFMTDDLEIIQPDVWLYVPEEDGNED